MVVLLIASFLIGWLVGAKQEQKRLAKYGTIGSKPKTQTDYQREHKAEDETPAIDFMHNWIQEKSGKKPVSQKRKPKTTKEWEDEFDIGGNS
jgi:hypothetical protein